MSINLKNDILNCYHEIELTDISRDIVDLIIVERNNLIGDLTIAGYEHLERIEIQEGSLQNIRSLIITNNPSLTSISVADSGCQFVLKVELKSILNVIIFI